MPVIVLEGPDHSGKTTLADILQENLEQVFKEVHRERSPVKEHGWSDTYSTYLRELAILNRDRVAIQDRTPEISESVYGIMRGRPRGTGWGYEVYVWVDHQIFFVFCQNSDYFLRGSHKDVEGNTQKDEDLKRARLLYDQVHFNLRQIVINAHPHGMRVSEYDWRKKGSRARICREIAEWLIWQWPEKHWEISQAMEELETI